MPVCRPKCSSQTDRPTGGASSRLTSLQSLGGGNKSFASTCRPRWRLGALRLLRRRGESLRDPADDLLHDGLGHLREVLVKSVVAPLVDLKGPGAEGGAVSGVKVGQKGFNIIEKVLVQAKFPLQGF